MKNNKKIEKLCASFIAAILAFEPCYAVNYQVPEYMEYKNISEVFDKLNELYDINNTGYYSIDLYKDNNYGVILEILNIDPEIFSYKLNVDLNIINTKFYIELEDIEKDFFFYNNKMYKEINNIKDYDMGRIEFKIKVIDK